MDEECEPDNDPGCVSDCEALSCVPTPCVAWAASQTPLPHIPVPAPASPDATTFWQEAAPFKGSPVEDTDWSKLGADSHCFFYSGLVPSSCSPQSVQWHRIESVCYSSNSSSAPALILHCNSAKISLIGRWAELKFSPGVRVAVLNCPCCYSTTSIDPSTPPQKQESHVQKEKYHSPGQSIRNLQAESSLHASTECSVDVFSRSLATNCGDEKENNKGWKASDLRSKNYNGKHVSDYHPYSDTFSFIEAPKAGYSARNTKEPSSDSQLPFFSVTDHENLLVVEDDLMTVTALCSALHCPNAPLLSPLLPDVSFEHSHPALAVGRLCHELLAVCVKNRSTSLPFFATEARRLIGQNPSLCHICNTTPGELLNELLKCYRGLSKLVSDYCPAASVSVLEHPVLSLAFGLKGSIDLLVSNRQTVLPVGTPRATAQPPIRNTQGPSSSGMQAFYSPNKSSSETLQRIRPGHDTATTEKATERHTGSYKFTINACKTHRYDSDTAHHYSQECSSVAPHCTTVIELKTAKDQSVAHRAQLLLYSLLIAEQRCLPAASIRPALFYVRRSEPVALAVNHDEITALVQLRNRVALSRLPAASCLGCCSPQVETSSFDDGNSSLLHLSSDCHCDESTSCWAYRRVSSLPSSHFLRTQLDAITKERSVARTFFPIICCGTSVRIDQSKEKTLISAASAQNQSQRKRSGTESLFASQFAYRLVANARQIPVSVENACTLVVCDRSKRVLTKALVESISTDPASHGETNRIVLRTLDPLPASRVLFVSEDGSTTFFRYMLWALLHVALPMYELHMYETESNRSESCGAVRNTKVKKACTFPLPGTERMRAGGSRGRSAYNDTAGLHPKELTSKSNLLLDKEEKNRKNETDSSCSGVGKRALFELQQATEKPERGSSVCDHIPLISGVTQSKSEKDSNVSDGKDGVDVSDFSDCLSDISDPVHLSEPSQALSLSDDPSFSDSSATMIDYEALASSSDSECYASATNIEKIMEMKGSLELNPITTSEGKNTVKKPRIAFNHNNTDAALVDQEKGREGRGSVTSLTQEKVAVNTMGLTGKQYSCGDEKGTKENLLNAPRLCQKDDQKPNKNLEPNSTASSVTSKEERFGFLHKNDPLAAALRIFKRDIQKLNNDQRAALFQALRCRSYTLIHGMPGTGKSSLIALLTKILTQAGKRVLIVSYTHLAIENIIRRLGALAFYRANRTDERVFAEAEAPFEAGNKADQRKRFERKSGESQETPQDKATDKSNTKNKIERTNEGQNLTQYNSSTPKDKTTDKSSTKPKSERTNATQQKTQYNGPSICPQTQGLQPPSSSSASLMASAERYLKRIRSVRVVLGTCFSFNDPVFVGNRFDYAIIDEGSQMHFLLALIPLSLADRFCIVGDHLQLAPLSHNPELRLSLFEHLISCSSSRSVLKTQYRMGSEIMGLSNTMFYSGQLVCGTQNKGTVEFIDSGSVDARVFIRSLETLGGKTKDTRNTEQNSSSCGINSHSRVETGQKWVVLCYFNSSVSEASALTTSLVSTVDRFQGSEADRVVVWFDPVVRCEVLECPRRLNVALTRARDHLVLLGDRARMAELPVLRKLLAEIGELKEYSFSRLTEDDTG